MGLARRNAWRDGSAARATATTLNRPLQSRPGRVGTRRVFVLGFCALAALLGLAFATSKGFGVFAVPAVEVGR